MLNRRYSNHNVSMARRALRGKADERRSRRGCASERREALKVAIRGLETVWAPFASYSLAHGLSKPANHNVSQLDRR
jgi:hypothetical protein